MKFVYNLNTFRFNYTVLEVIARDELTCKLPYTPHVYRDMLLSYLG